MMRKYKVMIFVAGIIIILVAMNLLSNDEYVIKNDDELTEAVEELEKISYNFSRLNETYKEYRDAFVKFTSIPEETINDKVYYTELLEKGDEVNLTGKDLLKYSAKEFEGLKAQMDDYIASEGSGILLPIDYTIDVSKVYDVDNLDTKFIYTRHTIRFAENQDTWKNYYQFNLYVCNKINDGWKITEIREDSPTVKFEDLERLDLKKVKYAHHNREEIEYVRNVTIATE